MGLQKNVSLLPYNTFGIDVNAKYFQEFSSLENIKEILSDNTLKQENKLILGGGSNILFTKNFDGLVLKNNLKGIDVVSENEASVFVKSLAGEVWHNFVLFCIEKNYGGIENLSLIPGNVGASPMQNIGAYGVEIKDTFFELEALNIHTLELIKFTASDCKFGYRESVFKNTEKGNFIITSVTFKLNKKPIINTSYGAIEQELEKMKISNPTIKDVSAAVCNIRSSKLPNPKEIGNAGSFFKNPTVSIEKYNSLKAEFTDIVGYPQNENKMKLAAGWLIEKAGWKGKQIGNAGVHKNQALVLVNYGNAKGEEVINIAKEVQHSVNQKFGILLEMEVNIL
ncbi:MAG: UDP-N-acetylmuramate dehydrogenase [Bacteroidota bacterium]